MELKNKLTKEDIEGAIKDVSYYRVPDTNMTICILLMRNGAPVTGESVCVSASEFNEAFGKQAAYNKAFDEAWKLEGYLLKEKLFRLNEPLSWPEPATPLNTPFQPLGKATAEPITPTIGRVIWYRPPTFSGCKTAVWPALICQVHDDRLINVAGFNEQGGYFYDTQVPLLQAGDTLSDFMGQRGYAEWMPYQQKQSDKQKAEASIAEQVAGTLSPPPAPQKAIDFSDTYEGCYTGETEEDAKARRAGAVGL